MNKQFKAIINLPEIKCPICEEDMYIQEDKIIEHSTVPELGMCEGSGRKIIKCQVCQADSVENICEICEDQGCWIDPASGLHAPGEGDSAAMYE